MDMVLGLSVNLKMVSLFSVTYVVGTHYTLRQFQCISTICVFPIIKFSTISFS